MTRRRIKIWQDSSELEEMTGGGWLLQTVKSSGVLYDDILWSRYLAAEEAFRQARSGVINALRPEPPSEEELRVLTSTQEDDYDTSESA